MSVHDEEEDRVSVIGEPHVDYILTADFDVDAGPIISHQYPEPLGGDVAYVPLDSGALFAVADPFL